MLFFPFLLVGLCSTVLAADDKWVWNGNERSSSNSKQLRGENGRYGVFEESDLPNEPYNPIVRPPPSNLPPLVRPPSGPLDRPFVPQSVTQRPGLGSFYNPPGNSFAPGPADRFPNNGYDRPGGLDRPYASSYPRPNPSFRPSPPPVPHSKPTIVDPDHSDPTKFDKCKCAFSFNCKSPGIAFGSCDVGKKYCCEKDVVHTNGIATGEDGPFPEVLAGPGGPVDHLKPQFQGPFGNRPYGGFEPRRP